MRGLSVALAAGAVVGLAGVASANTLVFNLNHEFSNSGSLPSGPAPWATVTFETVGGGTSVVMTIESKLTDTDGRFKEFYFNVDSAKVSGLSATHNSGVDAGIPDIGLKKHKADGDGWFDILFEFGNDLGNQSGNTESVYEFVWSGGTLFASDFNFMSSDSKGKSNQLGGLPVAAHATGFDDDGSGWLTGNGFVIPLPTTAGLGLIGLGLVGGMRRRRVG